MAADDAGGSLREVPSVLANCGRLGRLLAYGSHRGKPLNCELDDVGYGGRGGPLLHQLYRLAVVAKCFSLPLSAQVGGGQLGCAGQYAQSPPATGRYSAVAYDDGCRAPGH